MNTHELERQLKEWAYARTVTRADEVYACDADHAARVGLPVLSALSALCERVRSAGEYIHRREMESELRTVLSVAVGEAAERVRAQGVSGEWVPGIHTIPRRILERDE